MSLMVLFGDLFICICERTNTVELTKLLINLIFELNDKANDKPLLNAQKRKHLGKKKEAVTFVCSFYTLSLGLKFSLFFRVTEYWINFYFI